MCQLCDLRALASETEQTDPIEDVAHGLATAIVSSLFGEEVVKEAMENPTKPEDFSDEDREVATVIADSIFASMFGSEALDQVKAAREAEKTETPKNINTEASRIFDEVRTEFAHLSDIEQAEIYADRVYTLLYGAEDLAETKADPEVQAFLASKRAGSNQASKRNEPTIGSVGGDPKTAPEFLERAKKHMEDRAVTYDNPEGERSMEKTIEIFNTLRNQNLTEADGWTLMTILKMVRANQGEFKSDNFEDLVAYAALLGESEAKAA